MKKAFTLIELITIIAIIAILAAILFPVFAQTKESAKSTGNLSCLQQTIENEVSRASNLGGNPIPVPKPDAAIKARSVAVRPPSRNSKRRLRRSRKGGFLLLPPFGGVALLIQPDGSTPNGSGGWFTWITRLLTHFGQWMRGDHEILQYVTDEEGKRWPNGYARAENGVEYVIVAGELRLTVKRSEMATLTFIVDGETLEVRNRTGWVRKYHVSIHSHQKTVVLRHKPRRKVLPQRGKRELPSRPRTEQPAESASQQDQA